MKHLLLTTIAAVVLVGCSKPSPPNISIHDAATGGNTEAVKQHIAAGTDVNTKDLFGGTPLIYADNNEIIKMLINAGADVNYSPENGITPLASAVIRADKESAELLITSGADVNSKDRQGHTPLDTAKSSLDLLKIDEEVGLDMDDIATSKAALKETADLLRKHGGKRGEELKAEGE
jgi:ankyrin repeat protein